MLEADISPVEQSELYDISDYPFNFGFIKLPRPIAANDVKNLIDEWVSLVPQGSYANWVVRTILYCNSLQIH